MPDLFSRMWIASLAILTIIALVVLGIIHAQRLAKQRREALSALARDLGWQFSAQKNPDHDDEYANFGIFRSGHSRYAFNTLSGPVELQGRSCFAKAGDYHYEVTHSTGKSSQTSTYTFSYLIIELPYAHCPNLLIRHEGFFDKLKGAFGFDDIDFESEEFSRKFYVKSSDERFAYDVCHPRMIEFLLAHKPAAIDLEGGRCCLSDGRSTWTPEQFRKQIAFLDQFLELWPEHLTSHLS